MFQILLQSRSSSQQSYPDKVSMTSKDMKVLNVKAGPSYCFYIYQSALIRVMECASMSPITINQLFHFHHLKLQDVLYWCNVIP